MTDVLPGKNQNDVAIKIQKYMQDIPLVRATMGFNSVVMMSPFGDTTAVQIGDLLYRSLPYYNAENIIAELYMLNSKSIRFKLSDMFGVNLYMSHPALISEVKNEERIFPKDKIIMLPKPLSIKTSIEKVVMRRRSHRR